jgi:hypothetical protein
MRKFLCVCCLSSLLTLSGCHFSDAPTVKQVGLLLPLEQYPVSKGAAPLELTLAPVTCAPPRDEADDKSLTAETAISSATAILGVEIPNTSHLVLYTQQGEIPYRCIAHIQRLSIGTPMTGSRDGRVVGAKGSARVTEKWVSRTLNCSVTVQIVRVSDGRVMASGQGDSDNKATILTERTIDGRVILNSQYLDILDPAEINGLVFADRALRQAINRALAKACQQLNK